MNLDLYDHETFRALKRATSGKHILLFREALDILGIERNCGYKAVQKSPELWDRYEEKSF